MLLNTMDSSFLKIGKALFQVLTSAGRCNCSSQWLNCHYSHRCPLHDGDCYFPHCGIDTWKLPSTWGWQGLVVNFAPSLLAVCIISNWRCREGWGMCFRVYLGKVSVSPFFSLVFMKFSAREGQLGRPQPLQFSRGWPCLYLPKQFDFQVRIRKSFPLTPVLFPTSSDMLLEISRLLNLD